MKKGFLPVSVLFPTRPKKGDLFSNSVPIPDNTDTNQRKSISWELFCCIFPSIVGNIFPLNCRKKKDPYISKLAINLYKLCHNICDKLKYYSWCVST